MAIPHGGDNKYYTPENKIVYDGDIARAADLNNVNEGVDAALAAVAQDLDVLETDFIDKLPEAQEWASNEQGDEPDPVEHPDEYSAKANAQEAAGWSHHDPVSPGDGIPLADGTTDEVNESAKTYAANSGVSAGEASDDAALSKQYAIGDPSEPAEGSSLHWSEIAQAAAEVASGYNTFSAGHGVTITRVGAGTPEDPFDFEIAVDDQQLLLSKLVASDGFPDPALSIDADGDTTFHGNAYCSEMIKLTNPLATEKQEAALWLSGAAGALLLDSAGEKRISWNDGGGPLLLRCGSYYSSGEKYVKDATGATLVIMGGGDGGAGYFTVNCAVQGVSADDPITYGAQFKITPTDMTWGGYKVWTQGNDGAGSGLDADLLDGRNMSEASTASTVVSRNASGDINARLFRSEYDVTNATCNYIMTQIDTVGNNYIRPSTKTQFRASVTDAYYDIKGVGNLGSYMRFGNGVQICWGSPVLSGTGGVVRNVWWTFPAAFSSISYWVAGTMQTTRPDITENQVTNAGHTTTGVRWYGYDVSSTFSNYIRSIAVGRWK